MNWVDGVFLGIVGLSVAAGIARGGVRTLFSALGVVAGLYLAAREWGAAAIVLGRVLPGRLAPVVGFLLVFFGIAFAFAAAAWFLRKMLHGLLLGWLDRLLGAALGLLRAAVLLGVLALVVEGSGSFRAARESVMYPFALEWGRWLLHWFPQETLEQLHWDTLGAPLLIRGWLGRLP